MMEKPRLPDAISALVPDAKFGTDGDEVIWYSPSNAPVTKKEITDKLSSMISDWDAQEYARNRASAYDSVGNQLDQQYWDQVNSTTTWKDAIAKVKADNPKPE